MGTAVLLPEDCLSSSNNGHKGHMSEAFACSDRDFKTRKSIIHRSSSVDLAIASSDHFKTNSLSGRLGWTFKSTALRAGDHVAIPSQKQADGSKLKGRKLAEIKETRTATKSTCDIPVITILQRPKDKELADDLIVKFLMKDDDEAVIDDEINSKLEASETRMGRAGRNNDLHESTGDKLRPQYSLQRRSVETKLPKCSSKKGSYTTAADIKVLDFKLSAPKHADKTRSFISEASDHAEKCQSFHGPVMDKDKYCEFEESDHLKGLSQLAGLRAMPEHKKYRKKAHLVENRPFAQSQQIMYECTGTGGLLRLKRATTDPLLVQQLRGHFRSEVVDIPVSNVKSCNGFAKITSMSCPERWAGPSYSSSPAPSSLPLPKFFCKTSKISSVRSSREVYVRSIIGASELGSPSPEPCPSQGVALDTAFATKNLRRILKLDPF